MSQEDGAIEFGTKPLPEHEWLNNLVGEWKIVSEMDMGNEVELSHGTESVTSMGGLFAYSEGKGTMSNGEEMVYRGALGYDVSFKEFRYVWIANVSSHIWNYKCSLSEDRKTLTMDCEGPHMERDGETANYRDVITIVDENHRTYTSSGQDEEGNWHQFMKSEYSRI